MGAEATELTFSLFQLDFRRTDVTAKARLTYFKGKFTEVSPFRPLQPRFGADILLFSSRSTTTSGTSGPPASLSRVLSFLQTLSWASLPTPETFTVRGGSRFLRRRADPLPVPQTTTTSSPSPHRMVSCMALRLLQTLADL